MKRIQRSFLIFATKAYRTVSNEALQAIAGVMPIDQTMHLYKDLREMSNGHSVNAVIPELKKIETPNRIKEIHPKDNYISVDFTGIEGKAKIRIYTDGSKTDNHVGAAMVAMENTREIHTGVIRLSKECTVFQAELCGIKMAIDWIEHQNKRTSSYSINVDSTAALLAIADKHTRQPLAVDIRSKTIYLKEHTSITFHWVKGHTGLQGNERADYLAKIVASYRTTIDYNKIPLSRGKQLLRNHYTTIWNSTYTNSEVAAHTKLLIPTIFHRLSLQLWPNYILTQFLTNHGSFRFYLHRINKTPSPLCDCPEKAVQTAHHLMTECTLFSRERPAVFRNLPLHQVLKYHINTSNVTSYLKSIFDALKD